MQKKIIFTGGTGRFAQVFKKITTKEKIFFPRRNQLNIENYKSIKTYLNKIKPNYLIHAAALSRPMKIHEKEISKSINTNIIGTANIVKACLEKNIKLIYFSTNHVYQGIRGSYKETDPVLPINKYAISKFGGECSVQMYPNSLILRICMTERPFVHKKAFNDVIDLISENLENQTNNAKELIFNEKIEFIDVTYKYEKHGSKVLTNLNFKIKKGARIGIIGSTGSGKSTLVDLLVGLLTPTSGKILIDDIQLTQEYLQSWREKISYVSQDIYLLDNTFFINVAFGENKESIDEERVQWACKKAQISNFIDDCADGYKTLIGENGVYLSGGQKQRIAIARALYKNSSILVFDEATSALDNKTEKSIVAAINNLDSEITTISIAHRLSTIENCDWVYRINDGSIKVEGLPKDVI